MVHIDCCSSYVLLYATKRGVMIVHHVGHGALGVMVWGGTLLYVMYTTGPTIVEP